MSEEVKEPSEETQVEEQPKRRRGRPRKSETVETESKPTEVSQLEEKEAELEEKDQITTPAVDEVVEDIKSVNEPEVEKLVEKESEAIPEKSQNSEIAVKVSENSEIQNTKAKSKKSVTEPAKSESNVATRECKAPTPFYVSPSHKQPKAKITGIVQILDESDTWQHVIATMHGFGKVQGYIRK